MLEIKTIKSYKLPKYPQGLYCSPSENYPWNLISTGIASTALLALLGCTGCIGCAGPPPMPPNYMTEREARTVISQAFAKYGVNFEEDIPCSFSLEGNPFSGNLDGFNKELKIGYEYLSDHTDYEEFRKGYPEGYAHAGPWVAGVLTDVNGPSILVVDNVAEGTSGKEYLENAVEEFVHELQSHGIL